MSKVLTNNKIIAVKNESDREINFSYYAPTDDEPYDIEKARLFKDDDAGFSSIAVFLQNYSFYGKVFYKGDVLWNFPPNKTFRGIINLETCESNTLIRLYDSYNGTLDGDWTLSGFSYDEAEEFSGVYYITEYVNSHYPSLNPLRIRWNALSEDDKESYLNLSQDEIKTVHFNKLVPDELLRKAIGENALAIMDRDINAINSMQNSTLNSLGQSKNGVREDFKLKSSYPLTSNKAWAMLKNYTYGSRSMVAGSKLTDERGISLGFDFLDLTMLWRTK